MDFYKTSISLYNFNGYQIKMRLSDGYINASSICKHFEKNFNDYRRLKSTQEFINYFSQINKVKISSLIQVKNKKVYIHPKIAINFSSWISPKFFIFILNLVIDYYKNKVDLSLKLNNIIQTKLAIINQGFLILEKLGMDERDKLLIKDLTRQALDSQRNRSPDTKEITKVQVFPVFRLGSESHKAGLKRTELPISDACLKLGHKNLRNKDYINIGRITAELYRKKYKQAPMKRQQYVDGAVREVNHYKEEDFDLIKQAINSYFGRYN